MQAMWKVRTANLALAAILLAAATVSAQATAPSHPDALPKDEGSATADVTAAPPRLAGTWTTQPDRLPLLSEFDKSVWGPNAQSEQAVQLTMTAAGEGTLTIKRRVIDARGRTVLGSASVDEAKFTVGAATGPAVATRLDHAVKVVSAERRYPDDPSYRWPLDGARVSVVTFEGGDPNTIEVRYDTPDGKVAVAEVLRRATAKGAPRPRTAG